MNKFIVMTEEERDEKLKQQLSFFDYIYPQISARLSELEKNNKKIEQELLLQINEKQNLILTIEQYKKKIQRIEWFLIKKGVIELLGEDDE